MLMSRLRLEEEQFLCFDIHEVVAKEAHLLKAHGFVRHWDLNALVSTNGKHVGQIWPSTSNLPFWRNIKLS